MHNQALADVDAAAVAAVLRVAFADARLNCFVQDTIDALAGLVLCMLCAPRLYNWPACSMSCLSDAVLGT